MGTVCRATSSPTVTPLAPKACDPARPKLGHFPPSVGPGFQSRAVFAADRLYQFAPPGPPMAPSPSSHLDEGVERVPHPPLISSSHLSLLVFPGDVVFFAESIGAGLSPLSPDPFVHVDQTRAFLLASPRQLARLSVARLCVAGPASPAGEDGGSSAQAPLRIPRLGSCPRTCSGHLI